MINNLPEYAKEYKFIVYIEVDDEKWFYGAYNNAEKAREVANTVDGKIA